MRASSAKVLGPVFAVCLLIGTGCSEKTVSVSGNPFLPANVKLLENDSISLGFLPEAQGKKAGRGVVNASDLTFTAKDVEVGKYKIVVAITPYPGPDTAKRSK